MKVSIFLKYPQHVLITFTLQSQIINHNIYINSSPHDLQWVSYRYHDKRKSPTNGLFTPFMKLCLLFKLACDINLTNTLHSTKLLTIITKKYQANT